MPLADVHPPVARRPGTDEDGPVWRDRKRALWPLALAVPLLPFAAGGLVAATGSGLFWWLGPVTIFALMPLLDATLGRDRENPLEAAVAGLDADPYYRWCTYLYLPLQFASLVWAASVWASGQLSVFESLGLAVTVGCVAGIAINTAHELGHKHLYEFFPRTVIGSARSAVRIERDRRRRAGEPFFSPRNDVLNAWAMSVVLFGGLVAVFGTAVGPWLAVQAVLGFSLLEVVNYIEHYGLLRSKRADGRYERCRPEHSWNANNVASNVLLYQLQRHSDHHAYPTRRYQSLQDFDDVPQLPTGYAGMMVLAVITPLWRRVMDPRVLAFHDGDIRRANLHPRRRAGLLARPDASPAR